MRIHAVNTAPMNHITDHSVILKAPPNFHSHVCSDTWLFTYECIIKGRQDYFLKFKMTSIYHDTVREVRSCLSAEMGTAALGSFLTLWRNDKEKGDKANLAKKMLPLIGRQGERILNNDCVLEIANYKIIVHVLNIILS